ncbi:hypothetical protein [Streptomyces sp. x-80]|uniref:hypothetical protein n=1 Tax=Streptomyces sp. x-80 TaxID=2789282 RepID=UPI00397FFCA7
MMATRQTAAGIAMALGAVGVLQSPETATENERLRARVAELEQQTAVVRALHIRYTDSEHCKQDDEQWPCLTLCALGDALPAPLWQHLADALNACVSAGIPMHIEWDRAAGRWRLVHDDEPLLTAEQAEARRRDFRARMRAAGGDLS